MISFNKTEFTLGNIKYGETGKAYADVFNNSTETVHLTPANSSCSCTSGTVDNAKLPPNGKTRFVISLNTLKSGKGMNQVKAISLTYKLGKKQFSQVFRIKANVI